MISVSYRIFSCPAELLAAQLVAECSAQSVVGSNPTQGSSVFQSCFVSRCYFVPCLEPHCLLVYYVTV